MTDSALTDQPNDPLAGDLFQSAFPSTQPMDPMPSFSSHTSQDFSLSVAVGEKEKDGDTLRQMLSAGSGDSKPATPQNPHHAPKGVPVASYMAALQQQQQQQMGMGAKGPGMMPQMHPMAGHYPTPPTHHGIGPGMVPTGYRSYRSTFSKQMMAQFQAQIYAYRYLTDRKQVPENVLQLVASRYSHPADPHRMMSGPMGRYPPRPQTNSGGPGAASGGVDWMSSLGYGADTSTNEPVPNVTVSSSSIIPTVSSNQSTLPPDLKLSLPIPPPVPPQITPSLSKTSSDTTPTSKSLSSSSSPATHISKPLQTPTKPPLPHKMTSPQQTPGFSQQHPTAAAPRPAKVTTVEKPGGIDPAELLGEREKRLKSRISQRTDQLEQNSREGAGRPAPITDRIELKGLKLLAFQKELRYDIVQLMNRETTLETAINLRAYKIPKRQTLKDATSTERLEKFHRREAKLKEQQQHEIFLLELMTHAKEFREFHKGIQMRISKLKREVAGHYDRLEKEQKRLDKERMIKLMAEDDEGYKQLIDERKNHRLAFLLKQTDEHIDTMRQLVMEHQIHQKRVRRDQRRKQRLLARLQSQGGSRENDEFNKVRIPVKCHQTGEKREGQDAPVFNDLEQFLEDNPGWEVLDSDGDESEGEEKQDEVMEEVEEPVEVRPSVGGESDTEGDKNASTILAASKRVEIEDEYAKKGSKAEGSSYYALAHSYQEVIREQPSTLTGGTLKEYQVKGLEWMVSLYNNNLNGILADEMGLGKTIQTIALFAYLMEKKGVNGPHLVVVPLSTMFNWCMEFRKWAPRVIFIDYKGDPQVRKGHQNLIKAGKFNVLITTYDYVMKDKSCLSKIQWKYMIIDEGHRMKNHHCKLTQILNQYYIAPHRVLLTGTPLQNNLPELWALLNFLLPSIFKSCTSFEQWFNASFANTGERIELNEEETILIIRRLHKALRPFLLRRLKKEVEAQLPDKVEYVIKCDTSALQKVVYKQLQQGGLLIDTNEGKVKKHSLNNIIVQLRKLCNHPFMFERIENSICQHMGYEGNTIPQNSPLIYRASGKFELLDRILPKFLTTNHRVLLFCQMTDLMTILEDYLSWKGWKDRYLRLDGHTKPDDRYLLLQQFNEPNSTFFIFLLSTRAGGLGLNLQSADTVIIFDSDWNPHQDLQAQDRAHRIGQANEVRVLRLITTNSVEEKILATAKFKLNVDIKVIQAGMFDNKSTSRERRDFLVTLLEDERIEEEEDPIPDEETLNRMIARSEEEFQLFQRMDAERITRESMDELLRHSSRLMQEDELPDYLLADTADLVDMSDQEEEILHGKGHRIRDRVNYCEISESKWLKSLNDPALDEADEVYPKSRKRKPGDSSNEGTPPPKKTRKRQVRSKAPISMELIREMIRVWQEVVYFEDDEGRRMSDIFMELPSKRELPDYYQIITQPIDLKKVKNKILKGNYREWEEFDGIMKVLFSNARQYNMETSRIYEDSKILEEVFQKARNDLEMEVIDVNDLLPDVQNEVDSIFNPKLASSSGAPKKKRGRPGRPRKVINQQLESDEDPGYL